MRTPIRKAQRGPDALARPATSPASGDCKSGVLEVNVYRAQKLQGFQYIKQYMRRLDKAVRDANQGSHLLGAPDVYVIVKVVPGDHGCVLEDAFETSIRMSSYNPTWDEQFRFNLDNVQPSTQLCLSLFDADNPDLSRAVITREDKLLGHAKLALDANELRMAKRRWRTKWLTIAGADNSNKRAGQLQVWLRWEPHEGQKLMAQIMAFVEEQWNSASACQGTGFSYTGMASAFLLVASQCSWLVDAQRMHVSVPSAAGFSLFAAVCAMHACTVQMFGAAGAWRGWNPGFPGFSMCSDEDADQELKAAVCPALSVTGNLLSGMQISYTGSFLAQIPQGPLHVLCWMWQIGTSVYSCVGLVLVYCQRSTGSFQWGEAVYIALMANLCNLIAIIHFERAAMIQRESYRELQESLAMAGQPSPTAGEWGRRQTRRQLDRGGGSRRLDSAFSGRLDDLQNVPPQAGEAALSCFDGCIHLAKYLRDFGISVLRQW